MTSNLLTSKKRLYRYDNIKFILIVLVVVGNFAEEYVSKSHLMTSIWICIYAFHMPVFVFLFGLFSKRVIQKPQYEGEKIYSYIFLYVLYKIIIYYMNVFCGNTPKFELLSDHNISWFMLACANYLLIGHLIKKYPSKIVLTIAFAAACGAGYFPSILDFLCLSRTITFLPLFLLGYYIDLEEIEKILKSKILQAVSLILLFIWIYLCWFHTDSIYMLRPLLTARNPFSALPSPAWGFLYRAIHIIGVILLIPGLLFIATNKNLFFTSAGRRTLQIYFLHRPLLFLYIDLFHINQPLKLLMGQWWVLFYLLTAILMVALLSCKLLEKPFCSVFNFERLIFSDSRGGGRGQYN